MLRVHDSLIICFIDTPSNYQDASSVAKKTAEDI